MAACFRAIDGGLDMAVEAVTGAQPAWFCEWEDAPSKVLAHHWQAVPNFRDVMQVDWEQVPRVDILTGGSPCQDLSAAGKRAGMTEGTRSNLWVNMREAVAVLKPRLVVWENVLGALSASATSDSDVELGTGLLGGGGGGHLRALGRVLGDLAEIGYDAAWTTLRASDVGAPHHRARVFLIATPTDSAGERVQVGGRLAGDSEQGYPSFVLGGDVLPADTRGLGLEAGRSPRRPEAEIAGHNDSERPLPDTIRTGRVERRGPAPGEAAGGRTHGEPDRCGDGVHWGPYAPTVRDGGVSNGSATESGPAEVLRDMRGGILPKKVQRPIRGQNPIPEPKDMRTVMREQQEGSSGRFPQVEGATDPQANGMRDMPLDPESACAPQGQEPGEQCGGKPGHAVRELPSETSLGGGQGLPGIHNQECDWGPYTPAIRRWERVLGRPAPNPTELNKNGRPRLNAAFAEYLMGLPAGHVTSVPGLSRADMLKMIGNGVCPQQGAMALRELLEMVNT